MFPSQFRLAFALSVAIVIVGASALLVAGGGAAVGVEEGGTAGATPTPEVKANDDFVDAVVVPEPPPFSNKQNTTAATLEPGEADDPSSCVGDTSMGATVWYQYTPSANAIVTASTFGNFDTVLAIYTGTTLGSLFRQACAVGDPNTSFLFLVNVGTTYHFQIGGANSQSGDLRFSLAPSGIPVPPTPTANPTPTPLPTPCPAEGCPSMSLRVSGTSAGSPTSCDSNTVTKCTLDPGSAFTVEIVPDKIPAGGYLLWQTQLEYGALAYKARAAASDEITWDVSFLPLRAPLPSLVKHGDLSAFFEPFPRSEQTTTLVTLDFNCSMGATLRLVDSNENPDGTVFGVSVDPLNEPLTEVIVPEVGVMEINCVEAPPSVGGVALEPDLTAPALDAPAGSSGNTGAWVIAAGALAAVVTLTGVAWYARRPARK